MTAVDQETQDTRAAQQLSLVVWKVPHDLDRPCRVTKRALEPVHRDRPVPVKDAAFVAHPELMELGRLTMEEAAVAQNCPHDDRVKAMVDRFMADTVARMGYPS
jgi:hypothetical protein